MYFDDFTLFDIFENCLIGEEDGVWHDFSFLQCIALRYDPSFDLSFFVGVFLFVVFLAILHYSFVSLVFFILFGRVFFGISFLFDCDEFCEF